MTKTLSIEMDRYDEKSSLTLRYWNKSPP